MKVVGWVFGIAAAVMVLVGVGGVVYANTGADDIARGTTVAEVDVGGMSLQEATETLRAADLNTGVSPMSIRWHGTRYTFDPQEAGLGVRPRASATAALQQSESLDWLQRTRVMLTGQALEPVLGDTTAAVTGFVDQLPQLSGPEAINATVTGLPGEPLTVTQSRAQSHLDRQTLIDLVVAGVEADNPQHTPIDAPAIDSVEPDLPTEKLQQIIDAPYFLYVDQSTDNPLGHQSVSVYRNGEFQTSYPVATGTSMFSTDVGLRTVTDHQECPVWTEPDTGWAPDPGKVVPGCDPNNPLGSLWMGIGDGEGFHVSDVEVPSHGCIHMNEDDLRVMFEEIPDGTPVYVTPLPV